MFDQGELIREILMEKIQRNNPTNESYLKLGLSITKEPFYHDSIQIAESEFIISFLVPVDHKDVLFGKCAYGDFSGGCTHFEDDGTYKTDEEFEEKGVVIEKIINHRIISELRLSYFEPTDRLVLYLNLHRMGDKWICPYDQEEIIQKIGDKTELGAHEISISIRKSELKDYLAARKCGLLILRYAEVICYSNSELEFLPKTFRNRTTDFGHVSFFNVGLDGIDNKYHYYTRLYDSFWIDPASEPRRWDYKIEGELKGGVEYVFGDGERGTFFDPVGGTSPEKKSERRFFQKISFNPRVLSSISSRVNHKIKFHSLTNVDIIYPDGRILAGCINSKKQFQAFFGDIAKLDRAKQRHLTGYSEAEKAKISPEYFRGYIEGKFPLTLPFEETLSKCLKCVNQPWDDQIGETLLLSPKTDEIPITIRLGPSSDAYEELADIMLELRKIIIPEGKIDKIKQNINLSNKFSNPDDYKNLKSIKYLNLLFENSNSGIEKDSSKILYLIEDLRHAKSHPKNISEILAKYDVSSKSPIESHYIILSKLCCFILNFKKLTESYLSVTITDYEGEWKQIEIAKTYFENPF